MSAVHQSLYTPFSLSIVPDRREAAVVLVGELDLASAGAVTQAVADLRAAGSGDVVLDLSRIEFIDSFGLRTLLRLRADAASTGHGLALVAPAASAQRIFDLTDTRRHFAWRERFPA